jgi:hypothetical protein
MLWIKSFNKKLGEYLKPHQMHYEAAAIVIVRFLSQFLGHD